MHFILLPRIIISCPQIFDFLFRSSPFTSTVLLMNQNKSMEPASSPAPQNVPHTDASGIFLLKTLEPSLWNSSLGRRTFLKRTGAATAGTAIALHGFKTEVLASGSGEWLVNASPDSGGTSSSTVIPAGKPHATRACLH
jgi:hypothetical protein